MANQNTLQPSSSREHKVSFDFNDAANPTRNLLTPTNSRSVTPRQTGLGQSAGAQVTRSALGAAAYTSLNRSNNLTNSRKNTNLRPATAPDSLVAKTHTPCLDAHCMLLLSDQAWATESVVDEDLELVRNHRWSFRGAEEIARQGKSCCFFIRCLLEMQQNLQCDEEGEVLEPPLLKACEIFVCGQCGAGKTCEMYQLLSHFISNSVIFDEWEKFLVDAFDNPKSTQESFLVPHLEQVWSRFSKLVPILQQIFGVLDARFVWRHRLPKVGDLLREHMKRRCFSKDSILKNDLYAQEKLTNETIKSIKRTFKDC